MVGVCKKLWGCWLVEFQLRKLGFSLNVDRTDWRDVFCSSWMFPGVNRKNSHLCFLLWRCFLALFFASNLGAELATLAAQNKLDYTYTIYLTQWTWVLGNVYVLLLLAVSCLAASTSYDAKFQPGDAALPLPLIVRLAWFLQSVVVPASFLVFILFWSLVFPESPSADYWAILKHLLHASLLLVDMAVSNSPYRLLHGIYLWVFGVCYAFILIVVWQLNIENRYGGKGYVYPVLNFSRDPVMCWTILACIYFVGLPLGSHIFWLVFLHSTQKIDAPP